jgi:CRP-like cAMP-binding protein
LDTFSQLRQFPLLAHFDDESLRQVVAASFVEHHTSGSKVYKESDPTFALYIILRGAVRIERYTPFNPYLLGNFIKGEIFGDRDFLHRTGRGADAVTDADSEVLMLDPDLLVTQCEQRQAFELALYWSLWKSLSANLRKANDRMATFFSESDPREASAPPAADRGQAARFRVDMASKRSVFQEQKLSPMEINFLASLSKEERLKPGQVIFREAEPGDKMYVVLDGEVMISKLIPGVGEEALAFLGRGDYFGEMARPFHATSWRGFSTSRKSPRSVSCVCSARSWLTVYVRVTTAWWAGTCLPLVSPAVDLFPSPPRPV